MHWLGRQFIKFGVLLCDNEYLTILRQEIDKQDTPQTHKEETP